MANLVVKPVQSRAQKRQFLQLPWRLHRDDPNWIPPLRSLQKQLVGFKRHPFYDNAQSQAFLALRDGAPSGRILAIVNHAHNRRYNERRGFFGFFESIDDQQVASGLFDAARSWLAEKGIVTLRGPTNPSLNYECGMLIDGFDSPPTIMMPYNPPYYPPLLESYGFRKTQDLYAFWGNVGMLGTLDEKLVSIANEVKRRFSFEFRQLDRKRFAADVRMFLDIYNQSLPGTWGFVPLSESEVDHQGKALRWLIVPELTAAAEQNGRPAGVVFGLPDYNPRIKEIDGRLFPFGFLRLLRKRHELPRVRLVGTYVLPAYQRWGLVLLLFDYMLPHGLKYGMKEVEFSWVLESNHLSRASLERGGAKRTKSYRIYDYGPEDAASA
jgi:hypothetical protein